MSLPKTSRALKITMEPHRRHAAATDSCSCSGIHAGRRRRASSGANFAQFGTSPARTRCAMSIAFGQCAHPLRRQAHCQGLARTGWTVRLQSVPNRASARNRENFADSDILRLELVQHGSRYTRDSPSWPDSGQNSRRANRARCSVLIEELEERNEDNAGNSLGEQVRNHG